MPSQHLQGEISIQREALIFTVQMETNALGFFLNLRDLHGGISMLTKAQQLFGF